MAVATTSASIDGESDIHKREPLLTFINAMRHWDRYPKNLLDRTGLDDLVTDITGNFTATERKVLFGAPFKGQKRLPARAKAIRKALQVLIHDAGISRNDASDSEEERDRGRIMDYGT
ncbi:hypothetical protein N656DRAFT_434518 [Canariomyces notabilis]|uniref:Uncharacterized protein n=1 Tax=Canariomyces notabilis TaxID=2074819 RepID=A0AAN6QHD4_9PEZI|nr:hypothetical protein N656DRAFT_434518 [Canariomyces arenarius]